jgi:pullulanase
MDMGTRESGTLQDADQNGVDDAIDRLRALRDVMVDQGFVEGGDLMIVEDEGGQHSEAFWAARFPDALRFLFPPLFVTSVGG